MTLLECITGPEDLKKLSQAGELVLAEFLQVLRAGNALQQGHVGCSLSAVGLASRE